MNKDQLEGKWEQIKGRLKEIWFDLTEADLGKMKGSLQEAVGYLQEKYGDTKEAIEEKLNAWLTKNSGRGKEGDIEEKDGKQDGTSSSSHE